ncbi:MAG: hypothetical protein VB137_07550 [Burkholderia sp.]
MNRIQFQAGLSMKEFHEQYDNEAQCEAALVGSRWPDGWEKAASHERQCHGRWPSGRAAPPTSAGSTRCSAT